MAKENQRRKRKREERLAVVFERLASEGLHLIKYEPNQNKTDQERNEVVVEVQNPRNPQDRDHEGEVEAEEHGHEEAVLERFFWRAHHRAGQHGPREQHGGEGAPPDDGVWREVEIAESSAIRRFPPVVDRACAERPHPGRAAVLIFLAEIEPRRAAVVVRDVRERVSQHHGEIFERCRLSRGDDLLVLLRSLIVAVVGKLQLDPLAQCEVHPPHGREDEQSADSEERQESERALPFGENLPEHRENQENERETEDFGTDHQSEADAKEPCPEPKQPLPVALQEREQKEEDGDRGEERQRTFEHRAARMHDERVVENVEETQQCAVQWITQEHQEYQKHHGRRPPGEQGREEPVAEEREIGSEVRSIIGRQKLVVALVAMEYLLPERDQKFTERRMLLHKVHAVHVFLRARDVVVFVPEDGFRFPVPVEIGEV